MVQSRSDGMRWRTARDVSALAGQIDVRISRTSTVLTLLRGVTSGARQLVVGDGQFAGCGERDERGGAAMH